MAHGRYLLVSDLHLDASHPAAIGQFLHLLRTEAPRSDGLYILGDLFESWIGDDDDEPAREGVCAALRELTRQGVPCRIQHGNRDFLLGAGFTARTGCELLADPALIEAGGRRFVLSHGDALCTRDVAYQRFRRVARSRWLQKTWLALPLGARRRLAAWGRQRSHAHVRRAPQEIMDVTPAAVVQLLRSWRAGVLIHGHTHRPAEHRLEVDGHPALRLVLADWHERGSMLVLHADGTHQHRWLQMPKETEG
ncbi:MAG: UDP-2,3-diacylglucosamine diphosphatase [Pseudomonadota bacterium]|nr:UDP-2,3-diacylglucosamine diphosphatase [Pseudomonadota bacterium]